MAAKKKTAKDDLIPWDELPSKVKRSRMHLYEYIRTGELPEE